MVVGAMEFGQAFQSEEFALDGGEDRFCSYQGISREYTEGGRAVDEDELGIGYEEADRILYFMIDMRENVESLIKRGFKRKHVEKVAELYRYSQHKRVLPPIPDMRQLFTCV